MMNRRLPPGSIVGVTGSSGLVGSALVTALTFVGLRPAPWRREGQTADQLALFDSAEFVVHLAGEPIASDRWTAEKKSRILASRVEGTRELCGRLAAARRPPRALVCASAVGYYGDRGDELLDEQSAPGRGFLPEVVQAWEDASRPAVQAGIRVVLLRFGMILSPRGGALAKMLTPFQCGLGGRIGHGRQYWSWIALDDALGAIFHALATDALEGPVNAVAPWPETNAAFAAALGRVLHRPAWATMPAWAARAAFGQMADELLLASARVAPRRLLAANYEFRHPELDGALRSLLTAEA